MRRKLAAWILFCLVTISFSACSDSSNSEAMHEKAQLGLETLREISNNDDYAFFGYSSRDEIGTEELREPVEVKFLDIEALQADADPELNIDNLIEKKNEMIYPVHVEGEIGSSIKVALIGDRYKVVSIGSKTLVEDFFEMIGRLGLTVNDSFLLEIPGTELCFVGRPITGPVTVTPLYDNSAMRLTSGVSVSLSLIADALKQYCIEAEDQYQQMIPKSESRQYNPALYANEAVEPSSHVLGVDLYPQQQDEWCWAATGRMTMLFAKGSSDDITQCAQANQALKQTTCCGNGNGGSTDCDQPWYPLYSQWGFDSVQHGDGSGLIPFSFETLKSTLSSGNPVAFLWKWTNGGGHYQVAVGYSEDTSTNPPTQLVHILNPWPVSAGDRITIPYSIWLEGKSSTIADHKLTAAFTDIKKN